MTSKQEIDEFLQRDFPHNTWVVEAVGGSAATIKRQIVPQDLRPGNTVSGPVLMAAADIALYVAILGEIGIVPLTVTTSLNVNFLRKPVADKPIVAECKLIKLGRTLAVGEVFIYSEGSADAVAHAVGTYAIPRDRQTR